MNQRLQDVLQGKQDNYIIPFFWQHGAAEDILREYMEKIDDCGIKAVCLEARSHPDFVGAKWWQDVDVVMDEAKRRNMRVWILDDSHFPTGYANGAVENASDNLKRWSLVERTMAVDGPVEGCRFEVASHLGYVFIDRQLSEEFHKEELVAVIMGKRNENDKGVYFSDFMDVTERVTEDGWIYMDFPEGNYSFFIYTKKQGTAAGNNNYISLLEKDSVKILIDEVYEPHYQHYKKEFGKTFAGFFSDEPGFYNMHTSPYALGEIGDTMPLPWTDEVKAQFCKRTAEGTPILIPALFHDCNGKEREARFTYMDIITRMYEENFSLQIGKWCEERGVEYIGHVLEDGRLNSSLGPGTGHYFRGMRGQHMGGIDVVLNDLLPERDYGNGFFYHYELPVLAASAAHQNRWMKGRAMCEIFGAFGWSEGLTMMKWMADHMLVNGINWFVPHAFTEKEFPDPDCPPHFYAQGNNPQYRHMHVLFNYMNRAGHLLNGGRAVVDVAVFFPAEGSWAGGYRTYGYIGKLCLQNQISYEVICMDSLKRVNVQDGRILIGDASYKYLFADSIEYLPEDYIEIFQKIQSQGANIIFVNRAPKGFSGKVLEEAVVISDEDILPILEDSRNCKASEFSKWLRCYRYEHPDLTVYMFANSSMNHAINVNVTIPQVRNSVQMLNMAGYDALNQRLFYPDIQEDGSMKLHMDGGESFLFLVGLAESFLNLQEPRMKKGKIYERVDTFEGEFRISTAAYDSQDTFETLISTETLGDIAKLKKDFSGIIRYETTFLGKAKSLDLGRCYEGVEVFINERSAGVRIASPYSYDISKLTQECSNQLRIEVTTTLANALMDAMSMERAVEPEGVFGPVELFY